MYVTTGTLRGFSGPGEMTSEKRKLHDAILADTLVITACDIPVGHVPTLGERVRITIEPIADDHEAVCEGWCGG